MLFALIRIQLFDTDPDPYRFKFQRGKVPNTVIFIHLNLVFLPASPPGPNQKAHFVKFSLPANFVYSLKQDTDPDPRMYSGTDPFPGENYTIQCKIQ